jgi:hypothetical protein
MRVRLLASPRGCHSDSATRCMAMSVGHMSQLSTVDGADAVFDGLVDTCLRSPRSLHLPIVHITADLLRSGTDPLVKRFGAGGRIQIQVRVVCDVK